MNQKDWDEIIRTFPQPHILQTWEWGLIKEKYGWEKDFKTWINENDEIYAAALILTRTEYPLGKLFPIRICYVPRGPLFKNEDLKFVKIVLKDLEDYSRAKNAISIKFDSEIPIGFGIPETEDEIENKFGLDVISTLQSREWIFSKDQIQFKNSVIVDLQTSEHELLSKMKQKTRYNVRLGTKKGIDVRILEKEEFPLLYEMYAETANRDGFIIRPKEYYFDVWSKFFNMDMMQVLVAEYEGEIIAGLCLFYFGSRSWYLYGMSTEKHRSKMPNYLLQWEAMKLAKSKGCKIYDLWGAPDVFNNQDSMWGVFRFKEGFAGKVIRTIGAWDYPNRKILYFAMNKILPKILGITRKIRSKEINEELAER